MTKYFCDWCGKEIKTSKVLLRGNIKHPEKDDIFKITISIEPDKNACNNCLLEITNKLMESKINCKSKTVFHKGKLINLAGN